jgi:hypothetical protein
MSLAQDRRPAEGFSAACHLPPLQRAAFLESLKEIMAPNPINR